MTITTAQFLQLSPKAQREIVLDGMLAVRVQLREIAASLHKLNGWNRAIDITEADQDYVNQYTRQAQATQESADTLTEQILVHSQQVKIVLDTAATYKVTQQLKNLKQ